MGEEGLKGVDATACFSGEAWGWVEGLEWNSVGGVSGEMDGEMDGKGVGEAKVDGGGDGDVGMSGG